MLQIYFYYEECTVLSINIFFQQNIVYKNHYKPQNSNKKLQTTEMKSSTQMILLQSQLLIYIN
ncbi:unnamed protein product [Paramecium sonneborni]|uniref:Uncharacterized protein n=1 Tax=Paramecium sonneborni TaxID=65129 RepID=A0A8S1R2Y4_9CILI|nr:unnamed protein product [Paramecium sonneborni]